MIMTLEKQMATKQSSSSFDYYSHDQYPLDSAIYIPENSYSVPGSRRNSKEYDENENATSKEKYE
jgi:hypothetical protein